MIRRAMAIRLAALAAVFLGALTAGALQFGDVEVQGGEPTLPMTPSGGYFWLELRLINHGPDNATVDLTLTASDDNRSSASRRVILPPGGDITTGIGFPAAENERDRSYYGYRGGVSVRMKLAVAVNSRRMGAMETWMRQGAGLTASSPEWRRWQSNNRLESIYLGDCDITLPVSEWSGDMRSYIGLKMLYVSALEYAQMPSQVRRGLDRWVALGGRMAVMVRPEDAWPAGIPGGGGGFHSEVRGFGEFAVCRPATSAQWQATAERRAAEEEEAKKTASTGGMGGGMGYNNSYNRNESVLVPREETPALKQLVNWSRAARGSGGAPVEAGFLSRLGIVIADVPLTVLFFVMIGFVVLIGPVNYRWLRKRRRETLFLVTAPAIALVFCVVVVLFITFREGWQARGRAVALTLLDQETQEALTLARIGWYAPLGLGAMEFDQETAVELMTGAEPSVTLGETRGQRLSRAVRPRIPAVLATRKVDRRFERLRVTDGDAAGLRVVNGLGVAAERIWVVGAGGTVYASRAPLAAGESGTLAATTEVSTAAVLEPERLLRWFNDYQLGKERNMEALAATLPAGYYIAVVRDTLFFDAGVQAGDWAACNVVVGKFNVEEVSEDAG